jgi:hypothetical protein
MSAIERRQVGLQLKWLDEDLPGRGVEKAMKNPMYHHGQEHKEQNL